MASVPAVWKGFVPPNVNSRFYASGQRGQCTWYARGRFYERTGIQLPILGNAKDFLNIRAMPPQTLIEAAYMPPKPNSIAVWKDFWEWVNPNDHSKGAIQYGHVAFVEWVDSSYVYFTEANVLNPGNYDNKLEQFPPAQFNGRYLNRIPAHQSAMRVSGYIRFTGVTH